MTALALACRRCGSRLGETAPDGARVCAACASGGSPAFEVELEGEAQPRPAAVLQRPPRVPLGLEAPPLALDVDTETAGARGLGSTPLERRDPFARARLSADDEREGVELVVDDARAPRADLEARSREAPRELALEGNGALGGPPAFLTPAPRAPKSAAPSALAPLPAEPDHAKARPAGGPPARSLDMPAATLTFDYDTVPVNGLALPVSLGFALLLLALDWSLLVYSTASMWTHELGHAATAWLAGFVAIPLPLITILPWDNRSIVMGVLVLAAWVGLAWQAHRTRSVGLAVGAACIMCLQGWLTLWASPGRAGQWITFAGLGGETVLSTAAMLAFYVRLPLRWDFWRYPVLVTCAVAYVHALARWVRVAFGWADLPRGAALGDSSEGDVEKLVRTGEFTERGLARTHLWIAIACGVVLVVVYARMLERARVAEASRAAPNDRD